jgi:hypothetical protein|nr:hypothetical protein [Caldimonas sp.]
MLADFQQALSDITASPALCRALRCDPELLRGRYQLTEREAARLRAIAGHPGMTAACTVYRMNRLAPLAMNLRATLRALGPALRRTIDAYWVDHPRGHAHFYVESCRFADWLAQGIAAGLAVPGTVPHALARETELVRAALAASCTEDPPTR